jgi:hypothetical protein
MGAPCGCGGNNATRPHLTVTTNNGRASVTERAAVNGMPLYKVLGSAEGDKEFSTYIAARDHKHKHGGTLRAT